MTFWTVVTLVIAVAGLLLALAAHAPTLSDEEQGALDFLLHPHAFERSGSPLMSYIEHRAVMKAIRMGPDQRTEATLNRIIELAKALGYTWQETPATSGWVKQEVPTDGQGVT